MPFCARMIAQPRTAENSITDLCSGSSERFAAHENVVEGRMISRRFFNRPYYRIRPERHCSVQGRADGNTGLANGIVVTATHSNNVGAAFVEEVCIDAPDSAGAEHKYFVHD